MVSRSSRRVARGRAGTETRRRQRPASARPQATRQERPPPGGRGWSRRTGENVPDGDSRAGDGGPGRGGRRRARGGGRPIGDHRARTAGGGRPAARRRPVRGHRRPRRRRRRVRPVHPRGDERRAGGRHRPPAPDPRPARLDAARPCPLPHRQRAGRPPVHLVARRPSPDAVVPGRAHRLQGRRGGRLLPGRQGGRAASSPTTTSRSSACWRPTPPSPSRTPACTRGAGS